LKTLFSTDIVKYQGDNDGVERDMFSPLALQRFLEVSLPLMLLTFAVALGWFWYESSNNKKNVASLEKSYPYIFQEIKGAEIP
jgi:hypothetical protein